jgi:hypothetical protein
MEISPEQIAQLKSKGLDDNKIQAIAQQNGYTLPVVKTLSSFQVAQLQSKGLDQSKIQSLAQQNGYELPKDPGMIQSFAQSAAKPFLKFASSINAFANVFDKNKSNEINKVGTDFGYFGAVKPVGAGFDYTKGF